VTFDKDLLFKPRLREEDVEIPGLGTIRVRGMSRAEVVDDLYEVDRSVAGAFECRLLSLAVVAPALTEEEAGEWRRAATGDEVRVVIDKINELSSLTKEQAKAAYKELASDSDATFRDGVGGEAVDDGGPAEG
jgi:hypothetical protein